jgi:hypothetical protein
MRFYFHHNRNESSSKMTKDEMTCTFCKQTMRKGRVTTVQPYMKKYLKQKISSNQVLPKQVCRGCANNIQSLHYRDNNITCVCCRTVLTYTNYKYPTLQHLYLQLYPNTVIKTKDPRVCFNCYKAVKKIERSDKQVVVQEKKKISFKENESDDGIQEREKENEISIECSVPVYYTDQHGSTLAAISLKLEETKFGSELLDMLEKYVVNNFGLDADIANPQLNVLGNETQIVSDKEYAMQNSIITVQVSNSNDF